MSTGPLDLEAEIRPDNGDTGAVVVDNLRKIYGELVAVNASFAITEGEIFGILGPNGAGKSTTVECVIGLRIPDAGAVRVLGLDRRKDLNALHAIVGVQLQASALPAQLKVGEILELFQSFYRDHADLDEIIEALRLDDHLKKYYRSLSGGLKQRAPIALALIGGPKIVLDEMTTGLDPQARRDTWELIEAVRDRGVTILLVIHYMDEAERLCNRVALFDQVRVVAIDTPEGLAGRAGVEKRVRFVPSRPFDDNLLTQLPDVSCLEHDGDHVDCDGVLGAGECGDPDLGRQRGDGERYAPSTRPTWRTFVALTGRHIHEVVPGKVHR